MSTLGHPYAYIITLINIPRYYTITYREGRKRERERLALVLVPIRFPSETQDTCLLEGWYFTHCEISDLYNTGLCRDKGRKKLHTQMLCEAGCAAFLILVAFQFRGLWKSVPFLFLSPSSSLCSPWIPVCSEPRPFCQMFPVVTPELPQPQRSQHLSGTMPLLTHPPASLKALFPLHLRLKAEDSPLRLASLLIRWYFPRVCWS